MSKLTQYGHAFQIKALAILITDRDFLQQIADIVSPDYFDNDAGKWIIRKTLKYYNQYKTIPTMEVFKVENEGIHQELQNVAVKDLLTQNTLDLDFILEHAGKGEEPMHKKIVESATQLQINEELMDLKNPPISGELKLQIARLIEAPINLLSRNDFIMMYSDD